MWAAMSWRLAQVLTAEVSEDGPPEAPIAAQAAAVLLARPRKARVPASTIKDKPPISSAPLKFPHIPYIPFIV